MQRKVDALLFDQGGTQIATRADRLLCSPRDPIIEARRWVERHSQMSSVNGVIVVGLGAGHHIDALVAAHPDLSVLVIEVSENLCTEFVRLRGERASGKVTQVCVGQSEDLLLRPEYANAIAHGYAVLSFRPSWQGAELEFTELYHIALSRDLAQLSQTELQLGAGTFRGSLAEQWACLGELVKSSAPVATSWREMQEPTA